MMSKIIAVDCDNTIARSDDVWWEWMHRALGILGFRGRPSLWPNAPYNLSEYFIEDFKSIDRDPMDFWRSESTYDYVNPVQGSVKALKELHELGYKIVVVSQIKGNHNKNKWQWLQLHFPFIDGYISTKEKQFVKCDYFVDDRNNVLNSLDGCKRIKISSPYTQSEELDSGIPDIAKWEDIKNFILKNEEMKK